MTEENISPPQLKQKRSPFVIVLVGSVLGTFIVMNLITVWGQSAISRWKDLSAPPSGIQSLIGEEEGRILVKSKEGTTYSILVGGFSCGYSYYQDQPECFVWKPVDASLEAQIPEISSHTQKRNDCEILQPGIFPLNPRGQVVECVHSSSLPVWGSAYFALMTSGEVRYVSGYFPQSIISKDNFRFSINFTIWVAIILSIIYGLLFVILWAVTRLAEAFFPHSSRRPFTTSSEYLIFSHYVFPVLAVLISILLIYTLTRINLSTA